MRSIFITLGAIMLLGLAGAVYFIVFRVDSTIESRIERVASAAFGSKVEVTGVKTSLRDGTLKVDQILVLNPPGFENPYSVRLNFVEASVNYDNAEIKRVVIENPEFYVEERDGKINFDQILSALDSASSSLEKNKSSNEPTITIRYLRIAESRAAFESHTYERFTDIHVDAVEMTDLHGTPSELARQIARRVVGELNTEASNEMFKAKAYKKVEDVQKKVNDKLQELMGADKNTGN